MNISSKKNLQHIATNRSSDIDFKDFMKIDKNVLQKALFFS